MSKVYTMELTTDEITAPVDVLRARVEEICVRMDAIPEDEIPPGQDKPTIVEAVQDLRRFIELIDAKAVLKELTVRGDDTRIPLGKTAMHDKTIVGDLDRILTRGRLSADVIIQLCVEIHTEREVGVRSIEDEIKQREKQLKQLKRKRKNIQEGKYVKMGVHLVNSGFKQTKSHQLDIFTQGGNEEEVRERINNLLPFKPEADGFDAPTSIGYKLTEVEHQVLEAVLQEFTRTNWEGHELMPRGEYMRKHREEINNRELAYQYLDYIPSIKMRPADLLRLAGKDATWSHKINVKNALEKLRTTMWYFFYPRAEFKDGKMLMDKSGNPVKRYHEEVAPLMRVATVYKEVNVSGEDKMVVDYYQIWPSAAMVDQVTKRYGGNHFLLIPVAWREEFIKKTDRKPSLYTQRFAMWCRNEYEKIRRHNSKHSKRGGDTVKPRAYRKEVLLHELATQLYMPDSIVKEKRQRARELMEDTFTHVTQVGYLTHWEHTGTHTILYFNEAYYPAPGDEKAVEAHSSRALVPSTKG